MGKLTSPILGFARLGQYHVSHVSCFQAFSPAFSIEALMILEMGFLIKQDQMGRMLAQCMQRPGIATWQRHPKKNDIFLKVMFYSTISHRIHGAAIYGKAYIPAPWILWVWGMNGYDVLFLMAP